MKKVIAMLLSGALVFSTSINAFAKSALVVGMDSRQTQNDGIDTAKTAKVVADYLQRDTSYSVVCNVEPTASHIGRHMQKDLLFFMVTAIEITYLGIIKKMMLVHVL